MAGNKESRTERRIRSAFIDLLEEKGFYQIRVGEILERADVSRTAFYAHYMDKYQLIEELRDDLFSGLGEIMIRFRQAGRENAIRFDAGKENTLNPVFIEYFNYVQDNRRLWAIFMKGRGESNFTELLSRFIYGQIIETQNQWADAKDPEIPQEHSALLCSWAYVALFSYWINTDMKDSPERMAETLTVFWRRFLNWE